MIEKSFKSMSIVLPMTAGLALSTILSFGSLRAGESGSGAVPGALSNALREGQTFENYLSEIMRPLRAVVLQSGAFTAAAIEKQRRTALNRQFERLRSTYRSFDTNADGRVSRNEIQSGILSRSANWHRSAVEEVAIERLVDAQVTELMLLDANGDGFVTEDEIRDRAERSDPQLGSANAAAYLELIPPAGVLTARDLLALAMQTYSEVDEDGDATLSKDEVSKIVRHGNAKAQGLPKLPELSLRPYSMGSVQLEGPQGMSSYAGFAAFVAGKRAVSDTQPFTVRWTGDTTTDKPTISLVESNAFEVTSEDCVKLGTEGTCTVHVRLSARANGIYKGKLTVAMRRSSASVLVTGKASGWPEANLVWVRSSVDLANEKHILVNRKGGSETRKYMARNEGKGPAAPIDMPLGDQEETGNKVWWVILPESTCLRQTVQPGAKCSILFQARPPSDGMFWATIELPSGKARESKKRLEISIIARGVGGKLPKGVLQVGDACPAAKSRAEVAISGGYDGMNRGYFRDVAISPGNSGFALVTAECEAWKRVPNGQLSCNNPGPDRGRSTMRRYNSRSIEGPWTPTEIKPTSIDATLACRDGKLSNLLWSW